MSTSISKHLALLGGAVLLSASLLGQQALAAQPDPGQGPGNHLRILQVHVDPPSIEIIGESFDFGVPLTVSLGTLGDISPFCTLLPDLRTIVCTLKSFPAPGDYLLTIATGQGRSQGDEYDLTIVGSVPSGCPCFTAEDVALFSKPSCTIKGGKGTTTLILGDGVKELTGFAEVTQSEDEEVNSCRSCPAGTSGECIPTVRSPITSVEAAACRAILDDAITALDLACKKEL